MGSWAGGRPLSKHSECLRCSAYSSICMVDEAVFRGKNEQEKD